VKEQYTLKAEHRTATGKGAARKIRAGGGCPAVVYGRGVDPRTLQLDPKELDILIQAGGGNALIDLEVAGEGSGKPEMMKVIIREMHYSPLGDSPDHVDFYQVALDRKITIAVAVELVGTCVAVTNKEATLSQQLHEVTVECLPGAIPDKIEADISGLETGQALHVSDLVLPDNVDILDSPGQSIATVTAVKEEVVEEEEAVEGEAAEPEVIGEEKGEGEAASGE
jgi:large subunit ribosomal protein L25